MKIEFQKEDGVPTNLDISFWKTTPGERRIVNGRELINTTCQICLAGETSPMLRELSTAVARQNPLDNYNKIVGKKVALAKAIAKLDFLKPIPELRMGAINVKRRLMRQHIWNVFHQTFGRWN